MKLHRVHAVSRDADGHPFSSLVGIAREPSELETLVWRALYLTGSVEIYTRQIGGLDERSAAA